MSDINTLVRAAAERYTNSPSGSNEVIGQLADGAGVRQAVGSASATFALPTLGTSRRVRVLANTRCFIRFGGSGVSASVAGTSVPFVADLPEYVIVPGGATHFAVIRDTADGFVHVQPVVG